VLTIEQIRRAIREELGKSQGVDPEFKELIQVETGDSYLPREDWAPDLIYSADDELEKLTRGEPLSVTKGADSGWDEQITSNASIYAKGTVGYDLGITRTERVTLDGEEFVYAYAGDELADVRLVLEYGLK
jgi:hypothetical protein